jgi:hypothetical protein
MSWLRLAGLLLFTLGLLLIVIWFYETFYNGTNFFGLGIFGGLSFGFGLGLILRRRTKQTPLLEILSPDLFQASVYLFI